MLVIADHHAHKCHSRLVQLAVEHIRNDTERERTLFNMRFKESAIILISVIVAITEFMVLMVSMSVYDPVNEPYRAGRQAAGYAAASLCSRCLRDVSMMPSD
jgi:hypothetical protein